jgi:actin-like ATPase involved in cell morphogenesis
VLAGGGALLRGFGEKLREEVGLPVQLVDSPLTCVAEGAGRSLDELETLDPRRQGAAPLPQPPLARTRTLPPATRGG